MRTPHPTRAVAIADDERAIDGRLETAATYRKVLKFGGSSLATPDRIAAVTRIVLDATNDAPAVVVVSAFAGVTDALLTCARLAAQRDPEFARAAGAIAARHRAAADALFEAPDVHRVCTSLNAQLEELAAALDRMYLSSACSAPDLDLVASFGERLSALIVAAYLNRYRTATFVDARQFVITDRQFTRAQVDETLTTQLVRHFFSALWTRADRPVPVVTGFIGATETGQTTTIGRNGSDHTAAILGAALRASAVEIWTDVDGVLSADPRAVSSAFVLPQLSYDQAQEMSEFGAKVLHPATIARVAGQSIPILIKNTFNPAAPGTLIADAVGDRLPAAVSSMPGLTLLRLRVLRPDGIPRSVERACRALGERAIAPLLASHSASEHTTLAISDGDADAAASALAKEFEFELLEGAAVIERTPDQALVAVVGDAATPDGGLSSRAIAALGQCGARVSVIGQGGRARSTACVIDGTDRLRAVNAIHGALFASRTPLSIGVIGVGNVGRALLGQLAECQRTLRDEQLDVAVVAVADSRRMVVEPRGIDLHNWDEALRDSERPTNLQAFAEALSSLDSGRCAVVDCTASDAVVDAYPDFVNARLHIVTPNKRANVLPWPRYSRLRQAMREHRTHFLYEANVGAGLPVISTLRDLLVSGDRIIRVEGVFSGTLSYLFNTFNGAAPFSELVRDAHHKGFTEPDPREDLSGVDVRRKLLILAREVGLEMELDDVVVEPLIPTALMSGAFGPTFFDDLASHDAALAARAERASAKSRVLRYVATLEHGEARAGLREVDRAHPLAATRGADNVIAFTTERYCDSPLVVQGPGAGAEVTAMGVFSDIVKLLRYLPQ